MNSSKDIKISSSRICAVIPFYNEKETLASVINNTLNFVDKIVAVNDGSNDGWVYDKKENEVQIINLDSNYGKGKALSEGFDLALRSGAEIIITIDADLQHDPKFIPRLINELRSYEIVIGNRLKNLTGMPISRKISNKLTSFLLSIKTGQNIVDSQCGFRAYRSEVLRNVQITYSGFEAESEMIIKAAKVGYKVGFVDIPTIYGNEKSKMKPVQAIIGFLKVLFS